MRMIRMMKKAFKKWFVGKDFHEKNKVENASREQVEKAAKYVRDNFGRAITRLSDR
jgi:hypothetical protein